MTKEKRTKVFFTFWKRCQLVGKGAEEKRVKDLLTWMLFRKLSSYLEEKHK